MQAPCNVEEVYDLGKEVQQVAYCEPACVGCEAKDAVDRCNNNVEQFVLRDGVLMPCEVGLTKENEDGFNSGCGGLLGACFVDNIRIDIIVYIHVVRYGNWSAINVKDAWVYSVGDSMCEQWW